MAPSSYPDRARATLTAALLTPGPGSTAGLRGQACRKQRLAGDLARRLAFYPPGPKWCLTLTTGEATRLEPSALADAPSSVVPAQSLSRMARRGSCWRGGQVSAPGPVSYGDDGS